MLKTWFLDSATARELGLPTNGRASRRGGSPSPGSTNLTLLPGSETPEELIAGIDHGLYVTELIGHGVNMNTGDYSRGAAGFVIEKGRDWPSGQRNHHRRQSDRHVRTDGGRQRP